MDYTTDIVAIRDETVLLITRRDDPFKGHLALPGGYIDPGETPVDAAIREAGEETGLTLAEAQMHLVGVYDEPGRDPRGHVSSTAYATVITGDVTVRAGDDAATADWVDIETALDSPMAFDHGRILADAYTLIRG
jgi:8-oxo-dGTP diphosphatase